MTIRLDLELGTVGLYNQNYFQILSNLGKTDRAKQSSLFHSGKEKNLKTIITGFNLIYIFFVTDNLDK
jgi:hypothetical protein